MDRLVYAQINLDNLTYNFNCIKALVGSQVKIMAVIKANAYGHGAIEIAKSLEQLNVDYLGVACLYEGKILRQNGIKLPVLLLGYTSEAEVADAIKLGLTINVMDSKILRSVVSIAAKLHHRVKIHIKIDSGMHRLGVELDKAVDFITKAAGSPHVVLEGVFSHLASADEKNLDYAKSQLKNFNSVLNALKVKNITLPLIHLANSAATLSLPESHFNLVRLGIILFGVSPSKDVILPFKPKPVMSLKTQIVQVREISKGESVGYGRQFIAPKRTLVGTIPVGYADGFRRAPANWGHVLVGGHKVSVIGRVSMDQSSLDLSNVGQTKTGDEVVLIGRQGREEITVNEVAKNLGTINYEVLCGISDRVTRVYQD